MGSLSQLKKGRFFNVQIGTTQNKTYETSLKKHHWNNSEASSESGEICFFSDGM